MGSWRLDYGEQDEVESSTLCNCLGYWGKGVGEYFVMARISF